MRSTQSCWTSSLSAHLLHVLMGSDCVVYVLNVESIGSTFEESIFGYRYSAVRARTRLISADTKEWRYLGPSTSDANDRAVNGNGA